MTNHQPSPVPSPPSAETLRATFTNEVIRAIGALARQETVCREQAGQMVFVTGMEAAREYIVEHIQEAALAVPAASPWQPIESAPKDGTRVWLWNGFRRSIGWHAHYEDRSMGWHRQSLIGEPLGRRDIDPETHWMPLPVPPMPSEG